MGLCEPRPACSTQRVPGQIELYSGTLCQQQQQQQHQKPKIKSTGIGDESVCVFPRGGIQERIPESCGKWMLDSVSHHPTAYLNVCLLSCLDFRPHLKLPAFNFSHLSRDVMVFHCA